MRHETCTLTSGCEIELRPICLAEENMVAAASKSRRGGITKALIDVMSACAVSVVDPGPYGYLKIGDKPNWNNMARGDWFGAMLDLRCLSYKDGHIFEAELRCPNGTCGHKFDWEIDLRNDLIRQDMPEESREKLQRGEAFEVIIDGRKVKYTIAYVKTEEAVERLSMQYPGRDMAAALRARIIEVEGLQPHEIMDWLDGNNGAEGCKYSGLTSDDAETLRDAFDYIDGGVDTALEAECPKCRTLFDFTLPFSGIFLPGKGISKRRKLARQKMEQRKMEQQLAQETMATTTLQENLEACDIQENYQNDY